MKKCRLYLLIAAVLMPLLCFAQDAEETADVDTYVAELNAKCPFNYKEGWQFNSVTSVEDTVRLEIQVSSLMGAFLPPLTEDKPNVKRMWARQMSSFGDDWKKLVNLMSRAHRSLVIILVPEESSDFFSVTLSTDELNEW